MIRLAIRSSNWIPIEIGWLKNTIHFCLAKLGVLVWNFIWFNGLSGWITMCWEMEQRSLRAIVQDEQILKLKSGEILVLCFFGYYGPTMKK